VVYEMLSGRVRELSRNFTAKVEAEMTKFANTLELLKKTDPVHSKGKIEVRNTLRKLLPSLKLTMKDLERRFPSLEQEEPKGAAAVEKVRVSLEHVEMSDM
jgi:hypothetical protein